MCFDCVRKRREAKIGAVRFVELRARTRLETRAHHACLLSGSLMAFGSKALSVALTSSALASRELQCSENPLEQVSLWSGAAYSGSLLLGVVALLALAKPGRPCAWLRSGGGGKSDEEGEEGEEGGSAAPAVALLLLAEVVAWTWQAMVVAVRERLLGDGIGARAATVAAVLAVGTVAVVLVDVRQLRQQQAAWPGAHRLYQSAGTRPSRSMSASSSGSSARGSSASSGSGNGSDSALSALSVPLVTKLQRGEAAHRRLLSLEDEHEPVMRSLLLDVAVYAAAYQLAPPATLGVEWYAVLLIQLGASALTVAFRMHVAHRPPCTARGGLCGLGGVGVCGGVLVEQVDGVLALMCAFTISTFTLSALNPGVRQQRDPAAEAVLATGNLAFAAAYSVWLSRKYNLLWLRSLDRADSEREPGGGRGAGGRLVRRVERSRVATELNHTITRFAVGSALERETGALACLWARETPAAALVVTWVVALLSCALAMWATPRLQRIAVGARAQLVEHLEGELRSLPGGETVLVANSRGVRLTEIG